jgi:type III secretion protein C
MDPAEFWNRITKAYGLVWFFDGKIMFVYSNSELSTQIFRMDIDSIGTLSTILTRLEFISSDFSFRGIGEANVLIVTAPPQYLTVINDIATKFVPSKISDTTIVKVIPLKYAWAYDMSFNYANGSIAVPGVATLLQSIVAGQNSETGLSPFNVNVGGSKTPEEAKMVGILDDTPKYAKDINNSIKNMQNKDGMLGPGHFFSFVILYTVGMIPWTEVQPVARPLTSHRTTQTE